MNYYQFPNGHPAGRARELYLKTTTARSWEEDVKLHFIHGYVYSTPTSFLMGRPVMKNWSYETMTSPWITAEPEDADCWWVYVAAGDIREFILDHQPFHTQFYAWEHRDIKRTHFAQALWRRLGIWDEASKKFLSGKAPVPGKYSRLKE